MEPTIHHISQNAYQAGRECAAINRDMGLRIAGEGMIATLDIAAGNAADADLADLVPVGHTIEETRLYENRRQAYITAWQQGYADIEVEDED